MTLSNAIRRRKGLGWQPDPKDPRDLLYAAVRPTLAEIPTHVDLRPGCSPIEDQGPIGSCTANALVAAMEFLELKDGVAYHDHSRLFVYYNERRLEGTTWRDAGAYLRDGMKTLAKDGVCPEPTWPYRILRLRCRPSKRAYAEALDHQITEYRRIQSLDEMLACLIDGFPFVFGFVAFQELQSAGVRASGDVPMPTPASRTIGGHAVLCVGFDAPTQRFLFRNSWGAGWGKAGYGTMPYQYLTGGLSSDFWTVRRQELG